MRIGASVLAVAACGSTVLAAGTLRRVRPAAITIGQKTFVLREYTEDDVRVRQGIHEAVHRVQYRRHGFLRFLARYTLDSRQRLAWEAEARAAELCFVRARNPHRVPALLDMQAEMLQRYWVTRPVSRDDAYAHLRRAYRAGRACRRLSPMIWSAIAPPRQAGAGPAAAAP